MKPNRKVVSTVVAILVIALVTAWFVTNRMAKKAVEDGFSQSLASPTAVKSVVFSPLNGLFYVSNLDVDNPTGFAPGRLMHADQVLVQIDTTSLLSDRIDVRQISIDNLEINIDSGDTQTNVSIALQAIREGASAHAGGKKLRVDALAVRKIVAHVHHPVLGDRTVDVSLGDMDFHDITSDNLRGIDLKDLVGRIMPVLLHAVVYRAGDDLPKALQIQLMVDLNRTVESLGAPARDLERQADEQVQAMLYDLPTRPKVKTPATTTGPTTMQDLLTQPDP